MARGMDTRFHPRRVVTGETWRSAEGDGNDAHFVTVEDTVPTGHGSLVGNAYSAGPFKSPGRAELASQALQRRVTRRGSSDPHFTNPIYRKVL
jgi:hypothetical protein